MYFKIICLSSVNHPKVISPKPAAASAATESCMNNCMNGVTALTVNVIHLRKRYFVHKSVVVYLNNNLNQSIINYPTVCLWVCGFVTELLPNEGSNLNK